MPDRRPRGLRSRSGSGTRRRRAGSARRRRPRYDIDPDQELLALGAANLSSGLFGGFTADASLSQTATAESAGAKSQLAPLFASLPDAVLGAIVIAAVLSLLDVGELRRYWAWRRMDFLVAITAMVGVLLTTVLAGMVLAMLLSAMAVLYRASRPYVATLGRIPGYRATFADVARHPEAEPVPQLVIVRLDAPLYFFSANVAKAQILELVAMREPTPHGVLIDLAATADLDVTTADMLAELVADLRSRSIEVLLAQVKGPVRDRMRKTDLMAELGEDRVYLSVGAAVTDFQRRRTPGTAAVAESASEPGRAAAPPADGTAAAPRDPER